MAGIQVPRTAAVISVRRLAAGRLRITYPRTAKAVLAAFALAAGLGLWLCQLSPDSLKEPLEYALALLLVAPGLSIAAHALRPRPVLEVSPSELVVRYGPAFLERRGTTLPLDTLEVQVAADTVTGARYDSHAVSARLLAGLNSFSRTRPNRTEVKVYTLQVRNKGQEQWLTLLGSQLASEIENAKLAIAAAAARAAEPPAEVSPSPETR